MLNYKKTLLVGIYAPNGAKEQFFEELTGHLNQNCYEQIMMIGDYNATVNNKLDRSKNSMQKTGKLPKSFFELVKQENLIDVWRNRNPLTRDYTFYSARHNSFSRIDMIWMSKELDLLTKNIEILPRIKSDHNPMMWRGQVYKRARQWRLNEDLLTNKDTLNFLKNETKCYFETNLRQEISTQTVWDAYKAVIRGNLITLNNKIKREKDAVMKNIQVEIQKVESELKKRPGKKTLQKRLKLLQEQLNTFLMKELEWNLKKFRQKTFEGGNKPGKFLAWQLKKRYENRFITRIVDNDEIREDHEGIKYGFFKYYAKLFAQKTIQKKQIEAYLAKVNIEPISTEIKEFLNKAVTIEEIETAIKMTKTGKAPGPDGISAKFYKVMAEDLTAMLQIIMNEAIKEGKIPQTWNSAVISLIPKENQDLTNVKNYRPISLLNNDYKLFARVMSERLKVLLRTYIKEEQAGFLPDRQIKDNIRSLLNIIEYYDKHSTKQVGLFFADAEKAFDNLNWEFMFGVMEKMDLGDDFIRGVKAIYTKQDARIKINTDLTRNFKVQKGTRQGCPLSPLLFIMVLEVLLRQIRNNKEIVGLKHRGFSYKFRVFADDMMFVMEEPLVMVPRLLQEIKEFGDLAGFYINRHKSKIICKNMSKKKQKELFEVSGCEVVTKVKYLGIEVTAKNIDLYKNNYEKLWTKIDSDMQKWNKLQLSLLGRISAIKMNVLPRIMFLFQNIPVVKDGKQFKRWQRKLSEFVWAGKKPRIKMKILTDDQKRGGFQLPNLELYNEAVKLSWIKDWLTLSNKKLLNLEGFNNLFGWHAYLYYDKQKADGFFLHHYIRRVLYSTWQKYKSYSGKERPVWIVPAEVINPHSGYKEKDWLTYEELIEKTGDVVRLKEITDMDFKYTWLQYGQIKDLFETDKIKYGFRMEKSELEEVMFGNSKKLISKIYKWLLYWDTLDETVKTQMVKWAININKEITMDSWEFLWKHSIKISTCNNIRENCYKMIYRWYMTPKKLSQMNNNMSNCCWKCNKEVGSFYHMWWTCEKAKEFWVKIHTEMSKILGYCLPKKPEMFLVGLGLEEVKVQDRTIIWYMLSAARIIYAQMWKSTEIPEVNTWLQKLIYWSEMDKMTRKLREQEPELFFKDWTKMKEHLKKTCELKEYCWNLENF